MKSLPGWTVLAAIALAAIAAWPLMPHTARASSGAYVAPVQPDYALRDQTVAFYEKRVRDDRRDQISAALLGGQYMQRYRESGDVDDITRALAQAQRALKLQPQNNAGAEGLIGSAYTALHKFRDALRYETLAHAEQPYDSNAPAQMASLDMELGRYGPAKIMLFKAAAIRNTPTVMAVRARYEELTGHLDRAARLLQRAMEETDGNYDNSAQGRAWYHFRLGEVLFESGDMAGAQKREREAIAIFPNLELAYRALARDCFYANDWRCALDAGTKGANIIPVPETLGYKADAQQALGDAAGAAQTRQLIGAIERIGNAYHLNDRLLAMYYADHHLRPDDAYRIAQREVALRGTEIYAQDTLAWAAAMDGKWDVAQRAAKRAARYGTQDPRITYHARYIAQHRSPTHPQGR
ncbi:MAG: tetratricopeptide repeat protein [Candidatus Baltobacteraceae bacterium]